MAGLTANVPNRPAPGFSAEAYSWRFLRETLTRPIELDHPIEVHLVRHGETVTNAQSLVTGSQDVPLTEHGREQARIVGHHLDRRYDTAFHSALERSRETLSLALAAGNVEAHSIFPDWRLNERSLGALELKPWQPVEEFAQGDFTYAPAGGDSYEEVTRRLLSFTVDLSRYIHETGSQKILICGHMGPMRILMGMFRELSDPVEVLGQSFRNTEFCRVQWRRLIFPPFLS